MTAAAGRPLWQTARWAGLGATVALLGGLVARPEPTLAVLWYAVVPVLPAVFLVAPGLWRNVCPLATLNTLGNRTVGGGRTLGPELGAWLGGVGILLLYVLVPGRRLLFNHDGVALAVTVAAVGALAFALGRLFSVKAGFCNAICPVLPVERLYGQRPLFDPGNAHCSDCSACTARGCLDLAPTKSVPQVLGRTRQGYRWLLTPFGAFAASFPGFIVAYYALADTTLAAAGGVYGRVLLGVVASWAATALVVRALRLGYEPALLVLGALSVTLYYWLGAPGIVEQWGLPEVTTTVLRLAALGLVGVWAWRADPAVPRSTKPQPCPDQAL